MRAEYAAPTELRIVLGMAFYRYDAPLELNFGAKAQRFAGPHPGLLPPEKVAFVRLWVIPVAVRPLPSGGYLNVTLTAMQKIIRLQ